MPDFSIDIARFFEQLHELAATGTPYNIGKEIGRGIADGLIERIPWLATPIVDFVGYNDEL
jgi:hypothetical protein